MKNLIAILTGILIGTVLFVLFGALGASFQNPLPEGLLMTDPGYNASRMAATTPTSWLVTLMGIITGAFLAGDAGMAISSAKKAWVTSLIGGLLSLWTLYGIIMVPEIPLWFDISSLVSYLLFTYLGGVVIRKYMEVRKG